MEKLCPICCKVKAAESWNRSHRSKDGLSSYCKECAATRKRQERSSRRGYYRNEVLATNESMKLRVLGQYAGDEVRCKKCGYSNIKALTVDLALVKSHKKSGISLWKLLIRSGFPAGFQVICMNCREIKRDDERQMQYLSTRCQLTARPS